MEFKYDIKNNYYKMYGEANYLVAYKKRYLKNYNKPIKNYLNKDLYTFLLTIILIISIYILNGFNWYVLLLICIFFLYLIILIINFRMYFIYRKDNHKGTIIINEDGITDKSDITITFSWDKVELIGITKNTMAIVTDSPFVLILEPNNKILDSIKKYKDVKIINS